MAPEYRYVYLTLLILIHSGHRIHLQQANVLAEDNEKLIGGTTLIQ